MKLPILYTMTWPERASCSEVTWPRLDFVKMGDLTFRSPDNAKYPAMDLAYAAGRTGGTMTGVLSAANEQVRTESTLHISTPWIGQPALCMKWVVVTCRGLYLWACSLLHVVGR